MKINLPCILTNFSDYHDIDFVGNRLKKIIPDLKWDEIDFNSFNMEFPGNYAALFYIGKKLTKKETLSILEKTSIHWR